ncbi:hypothetical protein BV20DRAFT_844511 [Pilatotrama ljubarskyi]|nr:hypothetical protein BV20DRAFT_844511 [Pilatotrama ljubarskyi]
MKKTQAGAKNIMMEALATRAVRIVRAPNASSVADWRTVRRPLGGGAELTRITERNECEAHRTDVCVHLPYIQYTYTRGATVATHSTGCNGEIAR